ncbi:histidine triad nucleotide-binding protein [Mahella sp.]|uniref:histidine triad nucleotide-binding protein n=1 Tax=Mahella sp. TaxID=2798721 RepID=UPI0025BF0E4B|nr:histidine triad nucleotide-binding protein [Mahella sp.]MBZ4666055.1 histidine triad protein [Mahella sp.]MDK2902738.1 histidine triad family protein [Clostridiales bacterium]
MADCVFCKIASGEIPSQMVYQDDAVVAFKDVNPQAPIHILIIPRQHIPSLMDLDESNAAIIGHIMLVAKNLARQFGIDQGGFRIVSNCGADAGQSVDHVHFHLLGGRSLQWPPG